jgi:hypothetical protein
MKCDLCGEEQMGPVTRCPKAADGKHKYTPTDVSGGSGPGVRKPDGSPA